MNAHRNLGHEHLSHKHLSDDVLIEALYGVASVDIAACVRECATCAARWEALQERRAAIAAPLEIPAELLAAQRRSIYRCIEHPPLWEKASGWMGPMVAGAAAACVLAVGVMVHHSAAPARPAHSETAAVLPAGMTDTQLYSDVYAMEQSFEPSTASSIRVLFEKESTEADDASPGPERSLE
jgi:hypothetical protein